MKQDSITSLIAPDSLSADLGTTLHFGLKATWKLLKSRKDLPSN